MSTRIAAAILLTACAAFASTTSSAAAPPANETLAQQQAACQRGDMPACTRAGRAYENGTGVPANPATAATLYSKACAGKDGDGCARLGWLSFTGKGVTKNFDAGYALFEKGCDVLKSGEACFLMAAVNYSSDNEAFRALGSRKLMEACGYGYREACFDMALNFLEGKNGFKIDAAGAIVILDLEGCEKGHAQSCSLLAKLYREGKVIAPDIAKADAYARKGCELPEPRSPDCAPAAPATNKPAPALAPAAVQSAIVGGSIANSGVNFGASIETVRQSLAGRRVEFLPGSYNNGWFRPAANGGYGQFSDIDPRLVRFNYEFDAPEGPDAKLIGLVLTYKRDRAAQSAVYGERVSTLSKRFPLAPKSPTTMEATVAGTVVSVIDDPNLEQVYEIYRIPAGTSAPVAVQASVPSNGAARPSNANASPPALAADAADIQQARAAKIDLSVLGLQLGEPVNLPACPTQSLFEIGLPQKMGTTCRKTGLGFVEQLAGLAEEMNRQQTGDQTIPWDFTAVLPSTRCQDWISGCEFSGRLREGRLVAVWITTTGLASQDKVQQVLVSKYGQPTSGLRRGYRQRDNGAQHWARESEWKLPGLRVSFVGYVGGPVEAGGYVRVETVSAAQRSGQVQRANEAQKQQL